MIGAAHLGIIAGATPRSGGGGPWSPSSLTSLVTWHDASDTDTITEASGEVSQWNDKSGNGIHVAQSTAAQKPNTLTSGDWGSRQVLQFDGGDSMLSATNAALPVAAGQALSVFAAYRHSSAPTSVRTTLSIGNGVASGGVRILYANSSKSPCWSVYADNDVGTVASTLTPTIGAAIVTSGGALSMFANGVAAGTGTSSLANSAGTPFLEIGGQVWTALMGQSFLGEIAEVVVCDEALSTDDRQKLEGYLAHKWGISLPSGHPYEGSPP